MAAELDHVHRYEPPTEEGAGVTVLALHGTGGDENDLIPLARALFPGAGILSPRGNVLENGMPRFFRRHAEGVFDVADLKQRAGELAEFVTAAADRYGFDAERVVAVGYSNGANVAAGVLFLRPRVLHGAVLFKAMLPFEPGETPDASGTRVFVSVGRHDPMIPAESTEALVNTLRDGGADVTLHVEEGGHELRPPELEAARDWISRQDFLAGGAQG